MFNVIHAFKYATLLAFAHLRKGLDTLYQLKRPSVKCLSRTSFIRPLGFDRPRKQKHICIDSSECF